MPLTRAQIIATLENVIGQLAQLMDNVKAAPAPGQPGPGPAADVCPIHNVPWRHTSYGTGHPLNDGSGKWCNKVSPRASRRAS
jgi:hypothetical protein